MRCCLKCAAKLEAIPELTEAIERELEDFGCPMRARMQLDIAIDEIFSNIARYAYGGKDGEAEVILEITEEPKAVRLTFADSGEPFNPLMKDDPDVTLSAEERKIGGLGIFLVRKTMDKMEYSYKDGRNILSIEKLLG